MKNNNVCLALSILIALTFLSVPASAQDEQNPVQAAAPVSEKVTQVMTTEELSIYGEVQSVDVQDKGSLTVQYYDYDADDEKAMVVVLDAGTKLENANSIADIKKGDWADVTYSVDAGKNKALSIIVEKEEEAVAETPEPGQEAIQQQTAVMGQVADSGDASY